MRMRNNDGVRVATGKADVTGAGLQHGAQRQAAESQSG